MKILTKILIAFIVIIGLILIAALFAKKEYSIKKTVSISAPKDSVFNYVKYLKNQDYYSAWVNLDPNVEKHYLGNDGSIGFIAAWNGNNIVGEGEQEIKSIGVDTIQCELRFSEPISTIAKISMIVHATDSLHTQVTWLYQQSTPYPMNLMLIVINFEELIGNDLQKGLYNLKAVFENKK